MVRKLPVLTKREIKRIFPEFTPKAEEYFFDERLMEFRSNPLKPIKGFLQEPIEFIPLNDFEMKYVKNYIRKRSQAGVL